VFGFITILLTYSWRQRLE